MNFKRLTKRTAIALALAALALLISAGVTLALIKANTEKVENTFTPARVSCLVEETFENNRKTNVSVKNTGNVSAYIRATVVVNYTNESGQVFGTAPLPDVDYRIVWSNEGWSLGSDGFRYFEKAVSAGGNTAVLIDLCEPITDAPEGYSLTVQVIASAIQADPPKAVSESWNVTVENGLIKPN